MPINKDLLADATRLAADPRSVLAVENRERMMRYYDGRRDRRCQIMYVDGKQVANPGDNIGTWRFAKGTRLAPTWLTHYDDHTALQIPRNRTAALSILEDRAVAFVLFENQGTRGYDEHYWLPRRTVMRLAAEPTGTGPACWTRHLCRELNGQLGLEARGFVISGNNIAEPSKLSSEFQRIIAHQSSAPEPWKHATPHRVVLKREWCQAEHSPSLLLLDRRATP